MNKKNTSKILNKLKLNMSELLKTLNTSSDLQEISRYEDILIAFIISSLCATGGILNFVIHMAKHDPIKEAIIPTFFLLTLSLGLYLSAHYIKRNSLRVHILGVFTCLILATVFINYYNDISIIMWTIIYLILLISIIRIDLILFSFVGLSAVCINIYLYFNNLNQVITLTPLYFAIQTCLFITIIVTGLLIGKINQGRFKNQHSLYQKTLELYEELAGSDEELRQQNEMLQQYNTEIKENEERLNYMAYNDALTNIPNRKHIIEKINFMIDLATENQTSFAIVFIDLDGFKKINDTLGHHIGDKYLIEISKRLTENINQRDTVGRFGGDEFALIIQQNATDENLYEYVDRLRKCLSEPYQIKDNTIYASASFGISLFPQDATNSDELVKMSDTAMYKAKSMGKNKIFFYQKELKDEILKKLELEHELLDAIKKGEFFLVYQPQLALNSNQVRGFEALLRWDSPKRGIVPPNDFIPILEEMGKINQVGDWVLSETCKKIKEIEDNYNITFHISVNVSPLQIKEGNYANRVKALIDQYNISPQHLELEITESIFINNIDGAILEIKALKDLGVLIALDDFGTGYSSLNYLRRLPIDVLKIDKSFIWELEKSQAERKIVGSIINLVHDMNISVVAEGVETDYQLDYLKNESCDHIQGYLFSKPLDESLIDEMLNDSKTST